MSGTGPLRVRIELKDQSLHYTLDGWIYPEVYPIEKYLSDNRFIRVTVDESNGPSERAMATDNILQVIVI